MRAYGTRPRDDSRCCAAHSKFDGKLRTTGRIRSRRAGRRRARQEAASEIRDELRTPDDDPDAYLPRWLTP